MNRIIENFINRSQKQRMKHRMFIAILCVLSMVVSAGVTWWLRLPGLTLSGDPVEQTTSDITLEADPITWDNWIDRFGATKKDTEYAGGVWTDKSVSATTLSSEYHKDVSFTIGQDEKDENNFLVGLSAIGSTISIKGEMKTPTDTVIILDLSSSMYRLSSSNTRSTASVRPMIAAVNNAINSLLSANEKNRVGVVAYYGSKTVDGQDDPSTEEHSIVFLPLDEYQKADTYLTALGTTSRLDGVKSDAYSLTKNTNVSVSYSITGQIAGTYMQLGILRALEQFRSKANDTTVEMENDTKVSRQPVFIFMTDGVATAANSDFSGKDLSGDGDYSAEWGLSSNPWRSREESDFVTQLTASYAKEEVSNLYFGDSSKGKALFYTMGFFADEGMKTERNANGEIYFSEDVVDPMGATRSEEIEGWWNKLINGETVSLTVYWNTSDGWTNSRPSSTKKVQVERRTLSNDSTFPSNISQLNYVDKYYSSGSAADFTDMFNSILTDVSMKVSESPTYVTSNNNQSGYVTFVDDMASYMEVKKIEGIVLNGKLYSGYELAKNFNEGGTSVFGTAENPSDYGNEFYFDIIGQLGIDNLSQFNDENKTDEENKAARNAEVRGLITKAYQAEQLKGSTEKEFSNYIGWYADASNTYLGFWNDKNYGTETTSSNSNAVGDYTQIPSGAKYGIKSYFFLHELSNDESADSTADLMYVNVWVRTELATQQNTVIFAVPASVLPTEHYLVELDEDKNIKNLVNDISNDFHPIRLVYRVGLDEGLNADTLTSIVDAEYIANNTTADGKVQFYSNDWDREKDVGYGTVNTYSYFRPALTNDRYYYTANADIYIKNGDNTYELYEGNDKPTFEDANEYFTQHMYYIDKGSGNYVIDYYYMQAADFSLKDAYVEKNAEKGTWYIKKGVPHGLPEDKINQFASWKTENGKFPSEDNTSARRNVTGTLDLVNMPFVDTTSGNVTTGNQKAFIMGATLGNNGRLSMVPTSGHQVQKKLIYANGTEYVATEDTVVQFLVHEGTVLGDYTNGKKVWDTLNNTDGGAIARKATIVSVTVPKGASVSSIAPLASGHKLYSWSETDGKWVEQINTTETLKFSINQQYTIVEWDSSDNFAFESLDGKAVNALTFTYGSKVGVYTIVAVNEIIPWSIELIKYDDTLTNVLSGATFALYTLDATEKANDYAGTAAQTITYGNATWYLKEEKTTGENGKLIFEELLGDQYVAVETKAPAGHYLSSEQHVFTRAKAMDTETYVLTKKISNTAGGPVLPATGGCGTTIYTITGVSMMLLSGLVLMYGYKKGNGRKVKKP